MDTPASAKTLFYGATTLDGFLATRDDGLEWLLQFGAAVASYEPFIATVGAVAMGAATYEWLLRHHVRPGSVVEQPWPYAQPTWVFTHRRLPTVSGADIRFAQGDIGPAHAAMRAAARGRNVWVVGGGELLGQFWDQGLLDELIVQIAPVTLGAGKPLLPRAVHTPPLRLLSVHQYGDTFAELRYAVSKPSRTSARQ
ncbi:MAG TPA: dihydrofolate reductase family protein [Opitutaceae bacterium]